MTLSFGYGGDHSVFRQPSRHATIWRYLGLAQLLFTLQRRSLHFTRVDQFKDPFEGSLPTAEVEAEKELFAQLGIPGGPGWNRREHLRLYAACCWYLREHESEAMWKLYASEGIAIRSTLGRLIDSLGTAPTGATPIYVGEVNYIDYAKEITRPITGPNGEPRRNNGFIPVMHKRKSFEHEKELRAILCAVGDGMEKLVDGTEIAVPAMSAAGCEVPVDLDRLIDQIVVSPNVPLWIVDVVTDAVRKYLPNVVVVRSELAAAPYA